jgi:porphobilinogen synthase
LFGLPDKKDEVATGAWAEDGIVQQAARAMKREVPGLILMGDVCLCEYMSHGHCGIVKAAPQSLGAGRDAMNEVRDGRSEEKAKRLTGTWWRARASRITRSTMTRRSSCWRGLRFRWLSAGIDIIAPSDMMDGRVGAIRRALDEAGFINTPILSYAAKFASGYYGPFREAADSAPQFGDRRSYQMDGANLREAMREIEARH